MEPVSIWMLVAGAFLVIGVPGALISVLVSRTFQSRKRARKEEKQAFVAGLTGQTVLVHRDNPNIVYVRLGVGGDHITVKEVWRNADVIENGEIFRAEPRFFRPFDADAFLSADLILTREGRWQKEGRPRSW